MFDNLKKIAELKKMQDAMKKERQTAEKNGVSVTLNGNFDVEDIRLNPELSIDDQQDALKQCLREAKENIQKTMGKAIAASGFGF